LFSNVTVVAGWTAATGGVNAVFRRVTVDDGTGSTPSSAPQE
jgi:hypothetical protein